MNCSKLIEPGKWYVEYNESGERTAYVYEESACRLLGFESREDYLKAIGSWDAAIHPEDTERVKRCIADVEAKHPEGLDFDIEYRIMTNRGYRRIHDYGHALRREDGQLVRVDGAAFDIEDIVQSEKEAERLAERKSLFNYFIESYDSAYFVNLAEQTFDILYMSDTLAAVFGKCGETRGDMLSFIEEHVHPDDREMMLRMTDTQYVKNRLKAEKALSFFVRELFDGAEKTMRCQIISGTDEDHVAVGFMDVTDQAMEQQKRLLGAVPLSPDILTKANIGLWSFELDEGCAPRMYADEAMLGLIGLEHQIAPEDTYHAWYDNIDEGSYDLVADAVEKMISGEHAEVQYPWHHPNGETWVVRCGGVRNFEYTKGIRIEGTHQNVTELIHYDEEQRRREEQSRKDELARVRAEASNKAKTEFLFNMSHDIRTPMNAILGYTDIAIKHGDDRARVDESLEKIKVAGEHLLNLINDILEMSRIESGKLELSEEPTDIRKLISGVEQMSTALAIGKSIDFQTETGEIRNPYVYTDELHANEVLINLISNAVKYTPSGGKIRFRACQTGEDDIGRATFRFEVEDNGIGMSEEYQQHLFEAFSREKSATVSKQQGAGLGLSIVKRIVDLAGGRISVKSRLNEGSLFAVEVPMRIMDDLAIEEFEAENRPFELAGGEFSLEGKKVLLVEDNEMNREIATEILEEIGLVIDTAEDGVFALKALEDKGTAHYDFILMDIQMPVMNGYEATAAIRAMPGGENVKIIALSANAFEEDIAKSLECGMNSHVAKPIDVKVLIETLRETDVG